jgi:hypothetical protein
MTTVLYDEVVTVAPARKLTVVREDATIQATTQATTQVSGRKKVMRQINNPPLGVGGDPLVDGAAWLLSVPLRHMYAALWRVGLLEVRA